MPETIDPSRLDNAVQPPKAPIQNAVAMKANIELLAKLAEHLGERKAADFARAFAGLALKIPTAETIEAALAARGGGRAFGRGSET